MNEGSSTRGRSASSPPPKVRLPLAPASRVPSSIPRLSPLASCEAYPLFLLVVSRDLSKENRLAWATAWIGESQQYKAIMVNRASEAGRRASSAMTLDFRKSISCCRGYWEHLKILLSPILLLILTCLASVPNQKVVPAWRWFLCLQSKLGFSPIPCHLYVSTVPQSWIDFDLPAGGYVCGDGEPADEPATLHEGRPAERWQRGGEPWCRHLPEWSSQFVIVKSRSRIWKAMS